MVTGSFDRIRGGLIDVVNQPYNNFRITNSGGNIIQGQMNKISVTEVMLPYNTPTVNNLDNAFLTITLYDVASDGVVTKLFTGIIAIPAGFYDGSGMVTVLNNATIQGPNVPASDWVTFLWDPVDQIIIVSQANDWDDEAGGYAIQFTPLSDTGGITSPNNANIFSYPNLLWTLGFRNFYAANKVTTIIVPFVVATPLIVSGDTPADIIADITNNGAIKAYEAVYGSQYSGRYTDYVDIVSTSLSQAQYIRDSSTSQATPKRDIIARIYICTNVSTYTADAAGSRPFTIYRNFTNPKVIKWTADRSIDAIDLQLFDMYGLPLPNAVYGFPAPPSPLASETKFDCGPSNYAITFHVHEPAADVQNENVGYKY